MSSPPDDRPPASLGDEERELRWLRRVRRFLEQLGQDRSEAALHAEVLDGAVELAGAERGYLVRVELEASPPELSIVAARGFDRAQLLGDRRDDISLTVVERVLGGDAGGLVTTREEDAHVLDVSSVVERRVRAIACVPMRLRGQVRGVLYLDHRQVRDCFHPADLPYLRLFADQAALALETAALREGRGGPLQPRQDELVELRAAAEREVDADGRGLLRYGGLVGSSPAMSSLYAKLERGARTTAPVLIQGESGTGKEAAARELHARSGDPRAPLVTVNCAALDPGTAQAELFGHEAGAFTGAAGPRLGLFREAGHGTLLLDEIGDLSLELQGSLLRALQEHEVRPLGADRPQPFACRVMALTHHDLRARVQQGRFREDLFYRLDVIRLEVPPLRERLEDVPLLIEHFAAREGANLRFSPRALRLLMSYPWPGNVRELANEVRRLATVGARELSAQHLSEEIRTGPGLSAAAAGESSLVGKTLAEVERELVRAALAACEGNKAQAARQLGVPRTTLYSLLKRHGLE